VAATRWIFPVAVGIIDAHPMNSSISITDQFHGRSLSPAKPPRNRVFALRPPQPPASNGR
jgi:hypothetical protein